MRLNLSSGLYRHAGGLIDETALVETKDLGGVGDSKVIG